MKKKTCEELSADEMNSWKRSMMLVDPSIIQEFPEDGKLKAVEQKPAQPVRTAVDPNFVFPQYDSRDAKSLYKTMEAHMEREKAKQNQGCCQCHSCNCRK